MPLLGAHLSIAGGFYRAVESAAELKMDTVQVFTNSPSQWSVGPDPASVPRPLAESDVARFRESLERLRIAQPVAHSSYLINLGSSQSEIWARSVRALKVELQRAEQLGISGVVLHPGAATGGSDEQAMENIVRGLDETHAALPGIQARVLLENTAGQGSCLGWRFEQLAELIQRVTAPIGWGSVSTPAMPSPPVIHWPPAAIFWPPSANSTRSWASTVSPRCI